MSHVLEAVIEFIFEAIFQEYLGRMWKSKPWGRFGFLIMLAAFAAIMGYIIWINI
jgi:hypothetical protein